MGLVPKLEDVDRVLDGPFGRPLARIAMILCAVALPVAGKVTWDWLSNLSAGQAAVQNAVIQKIDEAKREIGGKIDMINSRLAIKDIADALIARRIEDLERDTSKLEDRLNQHEPTIRPR